MLRNFLFKVTIAMMKPHEGNQIREESDYWFIFFHISLFIIGGGQDRNTFQGRNLETEADAMAMDGFYLMTSFPCLAKAAFS